MKQQNLIFSSQTRLIKPTRLCMISSSSFAAFLLKHAKRPVVELLVWWKSSVALLCFQPAVVFCVFFPVNTQNCLNLAFAFVVFLGD